MNARTQMYLGFGLAIASVIIIILIIAKVINIESAVYNLFVIAAAIIVGFIGLGVGFKGKASPN